MLRHLKPALLLFSLLSTAAAAADPLEQLNADLIELSDLRTATAGQLAGIPFSRDLRTQTALAAARAQIAAASDCLTQAAGLVTACADTLNAIKTATAAGQIDLARQLTALYDKLHTNAAEYLDQAQTHLTTAAAWLATIVKTP